MNETFKQLAKPFPKEAYKDVSMGGYTMTTIDAYHIIERLTDVFGLMGSGWGVIVSEWRETGDSVACVGRLWYLTDGERCEVVAVGEGRIMRGNVAEAMKKAQTNLISKAASYIGVGLSVYQGNGIDDPYIDATRTNTTKQEATPQADTRLDEIKAARLKAGMTPQSVAQIAVQCGCKSFPHDMTDNQFNAIMEKIACTAPAN